MPSRRNCLTSAVTSAIRFARPHADETSPAGLFETLLAGPPAGTGSISREPHNGHPRVTRAPAEHVPVAGRLAGGSIALHKRLIAGFGFLDLAIAWLTCS